MPIPTKSVSRRSKSRPIRQSVTIPRPRGIRAQLDAQANLQATYQRFSKERAPSRKEAAGQDLIRAVFGTDAIAKDAKRRKLAT
jgi:hypothetical protein